MTLINVRNIPDGQEVEFVKAVVTDPDTGERTARGGFKGTATSNIMLFGDGKTRRLFVNVDQDKSGGFSALWVEVEEDLAESLFATIAQDPETVSDLEVNASDFNKMIAVNVLDQELNPLRGFAPDVLPRLCAMIMTQLGTDYFPRVVASHAEWAIKDNDGLSRVLLIEASGRNGERTYCLLRRDGIGRCKAIIIEEANWIERITHWWGLGQSEPPPEVGRLVASLVKRDEMWGEL